MKKFSIRARAVGFNMQWHWRDIKTSEKRSIDNQTLDLGFLVWQTLYYTGMQTGAVTPRPKECAPDATPPDRQNAATTTLRNKIRGMWWIHGLDIEARLNIDIRLARSSLRCMADTCSAISTLIRSRSVLRFQSCTFEGPRSVSKTVSKHFKMYIDNHHLNSIILALQ